MFIPRNKPVKWDDMVIIILQMKKYDLKYSFMVKNINFYIFIYFFMNETRTLALPILARVTL